LYGERNAETAVFIGSLLIFAEEFSDFAKARSSQQQLKKFDGLDSETKLQSCPTSSAIASSQGFQDVTVLKPLPPTPQSSLHRKSLSDLIRETTPKRVLLGRSAAALSRASWTALPNYLPRHLRLKSTSPVPARPRSVEHPTTPAWWSARSASIVGTVLDGDSAYGLRSAYITLVHLPSAQGAIPSTFTLNDGSFEFDYIPAGQYVLSATVPDYSGSSTIVNAPGNITLRLHRTAVYPCDFTVFNMTGWRIFVGPGGSDAHPVPIPPYQSFTSGLVHPDQFFARADFVNAPPLLWGPIPVQCGGLGYITIRP
jgi:hypothetical protein